MKVEGYKVAEVKLEVCGDDDDVMCLLHVPMDVDKAKLKAGDMVLLLKSQSSLYTRNEEFRKAFDAASLAACKAFCTEAYGHGTMMFPAEWNTVDTKGELN